MAKFKVFHGAIGTSMIRKHNRLTAEEQAAVDQHKEAKRLQVQANKDAKAAAALRGRGRPVGSVTIKKEGVRYGRPTREMMAERAREEQRFMFADVIDELFANSWAATEPVSTETESAPETASAVQESEPAEMTFALDAEPIAQTTAA